jgi:oligopeptide/dipeptide ABC transporter ATP-binding protein
MPTQPPPILLAVENLVTQFSTPRGPINAVDGVSFNIPTGKTVALVGESGCGKSVTSLSIMRLVESSGGNITAGSITFQQENLLALSTKAMRQIRGNRISMIFQEPMTSLNPVFSIGNQIAEVYRTHRQLSTKDAWREAEAMLSLVKIPSATRIMRCYPHQLSGGMLQRVMIAMALACRPQLLIADEPTTALDVTIQAQILALMEDLQQELGMAILLVTHDLGVVAEMCDYLLVMYAGRIIEEGPTAEIFSRAAHPYTRGLLQSIPKLGCKRERLYSIEGRVPNLYELPVGCRFFDRCPQAMERCRTHYPPIQELVSGQRVACWLTAKE